MSGIVCPLRGGKAGRTTATRAILLAKETGLPVHFVYVINGELLPDAPIQGAPSVEGQLREMASTMLLAAQALANSQGVSAESAVRRGPVENELITQCLDVDADYLVLNTTGGRQRETSLFTPPRLARFVDRVQSEAGTRVLFA